MIDFSHLSPADLQSIGIYFGTQEETEAFIDLMIEEMEVRTGEAISEGRAKEEMAAFEACETDEEVRRWLNAHCPDYKEKIKNINKQLETELILHRNLIIGRDGND